MASPATTNARATIENDPDFWAGFEQEYFLYKDGHPLGFPEHGHPSTPQGPYYCGGGYKYMGSLARTIVDEHLDRRSIAPPLGHVHALAFSPAERFLAAACEEGLIVWTVPELDIELMVRGDGIRTLYEQAEALG